MSTTKSCHPILVLIRNKWQIKLLVPRVAGQKKCNEFNSLPIRCQYLSNHLKFWPWVPNDWLESQDPSNWHWLMLVNYCLDAVLPLSTHILSICRGKKWIHLFSGFGAHSKNLHGIIQIHYSKYGKRVFKVLEDQEDLWYLRLSANKINRCIKPNKHNSSYKKR